MEFMNRQITSAAIAPPAANYAHAIVSEGAGRTLHSAGIVGVRPDGSVPATVGEQAEVIWTSIAALLEEAGMAAADIVSITTYVVASQLGELGTVMAARDRHLGGHLAASTLVTVPALVRPEWLMEVAVVAVAA
jgi:enamine deaminase RidA (YjgF/YER057c/UK114 family)